MQRVGVREIKERDGADLLERILSRENLNRAYKRVKANKGAPGMDGIPTVIDRIIQQTIAQQLVPIYEPLFTEDSYGYRPKRSAQQAIQRVKEYAEQGYTQAVLVDLSKYFDTLNHELLVNLLRKNVHDKRVIEFIKRYLKAGVMENGLLVKTKEGSPQGGPLSPLLANIYLNEHDQEMARRGVHMVRYADHSGTGKEPKSGTAAVGEYPAVS